MKFLVLSAVAIAAIAVEPTSAGSCSAWCSSTDCPFMPTIANGATVTYSAATSCEDIVGVGSHRYLKAGSIISAADDSDLIISFPGASDPETPQRDICYYETSTSMGKTAATASDVMISIKCNNWIMNCPLRLGIVWGCFVPCCYTYNASTQKYTISCIDGTQRTPAVLGGAIGYMDSERGLFESVRQCTPPPTTAAPTPSPTFSYASFTEGFDQRFKRTAISEWCNQPTSCEYRCSRGYRVWSSQGNVTFKPPSSLDGCDCPILVGSLLNSTTALIKSTGTRVQYDTRRNTTMTMDRDWCSMQYMLGEPANPFEAKSYVRDSVSPAECNVPALCSYMCSAGYSLDFIGNDKVRATPAVANPSASCSCYPIFATIYDNGTAAGSDGSTSYRLAKTPSGITVDLVVNGVTCRGTYSPGLLATAAPATTPPPTTAAPTAAPTLSPTFSDASFADGFDQRFKRTAISESCSQPTSCEYRCSRGYRVSSSQGVVTFKPSFSIDGCDCLLLTGSAVGPTTALIDRIGMRVQYDTRQNATMTANQNGCVMQYMPGEPFNPFETKSYVRDSASPGECSLPIRESCYYMCSTGYSIDFVGDDKVRATPAVAIPSASCSCYPVFATIRDNGTAVGSDVSISYRLARTSSGITVDLTTANGMTCRGTYSPGTYVVNKSSSASAVQNMLWATVVASVLAFAVASFGVAT